MLDNFPGCHAAACHLLSKGRCHAEFVSRTPATRTLKGDEKRFELAGDRSKIRLFMQIIHSLLIIRTSVYNPGQAEAFGSKKLCQHLKKELERLEM